MKRYEYQVDKWCNTETRDGNLEDWLSKWGMKGYRAIYIENSQESIGVIFLVIFEKEVTSDEQD